MLLATGSVVRGQSSTAEIVTELRVHGNYSIPDAEVYALVEVTAGDPIEAGTLESITTRLRESGRFETVEVRKRYTSLTRRDAVALIVLVRERPGAADTTRTGLGRLLSILTQQTMFLPIVRYAEGYGFTYGARFTLVEVLGEGGSLMVPLTLGGTRQAGVEFEKRFVTGLVDTLQVGVATIRQENQHYLQLDQRYSAWGGADRTLFGPLRLVGRAEWSDVSFGVLRESVATYRVGLDLDTRRNVGFPRDAVFARAMWQWLDPTGPDAGLSQPWVDARGFIGLFGQTVFAVRAQYQGASAAVPVYAQPLLGGLMSVRGHRVGHRAGDRLATASAEVRFPLSSPLSFAKVGWRVFYDTGTVFNVGESLEASQFSQGAGAGVFLNAAFLNLQLDVAHDLHGHARLHVGTSVSF
ncbi:MAG: BamA/TamA family outer membrane protein [Acidobacteriota bacterium]|nr:BamA/TamA family outer membrane protein [Acidobacteriota bacterium]